MGVWERSPAGIAIALENEGLVESFRRALPDFVTEDVVGSPYCIRDYRVDAHLGGPEGLAAARAALDGARIGLILTSSRTTSPPTTRTDAHGVFVVAVTTTSSAIRRRSCVSAAASLPTVAIRLPGLAGRRAAERLLA